LVHGSKSPSKGTARGPQEIAAALASSKGTKYCPTGFPCSAWRSMRLCPSRASGVHLGRDKDKMVGAMKNATALIGSKDRWR